MLENEPLEIRLLDERDIPAAMRLKELARWNQTESDWRRLLRLEPRGCFGAMLNGRLVGTTTAITYGDELAWIGMVLVDPEYRRRRIATRLMQAALDYLSGRVALVKLDATPDGRPVYETLGFQIESLVERWTGRAQEEKAEAAAAMPVAGCLALEASAHDDILALDRRAFGADRSKLIEALLAESCVAPKAIVTEGRMSGYALARRGSQAAYVGPLVATGAQQAATLLDGLLGQLAGQQVYVDVNTNFKGGAEILAARGFIKQRDLVRMVYGARNGGTTSGSVFAIAGPEFG